MVAKVVSSLTRSGTSRGQSDACVNAIRLALEDVGYRVAGMPVAYEDWDGGSEARGAWDPEAEARNAHYAVREGALAYLGPLDADGAPISAPILNAAGLLMVSPCASYPGLTKPVPGIPDEPEVYRPSGRCNFIRTAMADDRQAAAGAAWAAELGVESVAVVHDDEPYGRGVADAFAVAAREQGIEVVLGSEAMEPAAASYASLCERVVAADAQLLYYGGRIQNGPGQLWRDLEARAPAIRRMGADGLSERAFLPLAGDAAEGTLITFGSIPPAWLTGRGAEFYARYKDKFLAEPESYAASAYDAASLVLAAIAEGGSDQAAVLEAAFATRAFAGAQGTFDVLPSGDTSLSTTARLTVRDGTFAFLGTFDVD